MCVHSAGMSCILPSCIFLLSFSYFHSSKYICTCATFRTNEALIRGTEDANLPLTAFAMITRGPVELVEYFIVDKKDKVLRSLSHDAGQADYVEDEDKNVDGSKKVNLPVLQVVMERNIDLLHPYLKSWPEALALLLEPKNIPYTVQLLFQISHELCEASDIRASRMNWYMERGSVFVLLCCSELYLLSDDSEGCVDTRYVMIFYRNC